MKKNIKKIFNLNKIEINDEKIDKFFEYFQFLIQENEKYNLTAITELNEVVEKHFIDSIISEKYIKKDASVVDVGTGAGFPGVPLKIIRSDIKLYLVDSLQKRINFLNLLTKKLNLSEIFTNHSRIEDFAKNNREKFDVAVSRAVAKTNTLVEYLLPLVKLHGFAIMYKSQDIDKELKEAENAIKILGGKIVYKELFTIGENKRQLIVIEKIKQTPKQYPREKNLPKLKPIL